MAAILEQKASIRGSDILVDNGEESQKISAVHFLAKDFVHH